MTGNLANSRSVIVQAELGKLFAKHKAVTIDLVLRAASSAKSPLHQFFEWDDGIAAQRWREEQARGLIQDYMSLSVPAARVAPAPGPSADELLGSSAPASAVASLPRVFSKPLRAALPTHEHPNEYAPRSTVLGDAKLRARTVADALREIKSWREKWRDLSPELDPLFVAVDSTGMV